MSILWPMKLFDPEEGFSVVERKLPHWSQAGTLCFITWRTDDSIPEPVLKRWYSNRMNWLRDHGIDPHQADWKADFHQLDLDIQSEFVKTFSAQWHDNLDRCYGSCVFRNLDLAAEVETSLRKFDGERYGLTDFVIMPNHVHILAAFKDEAGMLSQCESWKHYTARVLNQKLQTSGRFWQQDGFDHLVRSVTQFETLRRYIANNPTKARLKQGEYVHFSKNMGQRK